MQIERSDNYFVKKDTASDFFYSDAKPPTTEELDQAEESLYIGEVPDYKHPFAFEETYVGTPLRKTKRNQRKTE